MRLLNPYLHFNGKCEEAFNFYAKVLGGEIVTMMPHKGTPAEEHVPAEWRNKIIHARLIVGDKLLMASDYSGVIQGFAAGQVDLSYMSPASYAAAWIESNGDVVPLVVTQEQDGSNSYVAVMYVRADSGIASLGEMKGHSLAWADPNSASGYLIPRSEFRAMGIDPEPGKYFGRTGFGGGHEQAVVAVLNHQYEGGVTWTSGGALIGRAVV